MARRHPRDPFEVSDRTPPPPPGPQERALMERIARAKAQRVHFHAPITSVEQRLAAAENELATLKEQRATAKSAWDASVMVVTNIGDVLKSLRDKITNQVKAERAEKKKVKAAFASIDGAASLLALVDECAGVAAAKADLDAKLLKELTSNRAKVVAQEREKAGRLHTIDSDIAETESCVASFKDSLGPLRTSAALHQARVERLERQHFGLVLERNNLHFDTNGATAGILVRSLAALGTPALLGRLCISKAWQQRSNVVVERRGNLKTIVMRAMQSDFSGKYEEDGTAHAFPRYKLRHKPHGNEYFLFRFTDGRWMVGEEDDIDKGKDGDTVFICSVTTGAPLPLNLKWEHWSDSKEKWQTAPALTTTDIIPAPPQSIAMQGHTGGKADLMGVYDLEKKKEVNGMPLYKSRHTPCGGGKHAFLYRNNKGHWMVGAEEDIAKNMGRIESTAQGVLLPLGLAWRWYDGAEWQKDEALTTTDIIPPPPQSIVMQGHTAERAELMGVYDVEKKEANGMPLYKSRHTPCKGGREHAFLYRSSGGSWMVGEEEDIAKNQGWILSATKGALLPLGLAWEWYDGENRTRTSSHQDEALTTTDSIPPPPQSIVMQGHTGKQDKFMGVYDLEEKEANGMPFYKSRHKLDGGASHAFLYRNNDGKWVVGEKDSIATSANVWIQSAARGAISPVGLAWTVRWFGDNFLADAEPMTVVVPAPPQSIVLQGRTEQRQHVFMGVYDLETIADTKGMPVYKSRHTPIEGDKHAFIFRDSKGLWLVGEDAEEGEDWAGCWIQESTTSGVPSFALSPLGLAWELYDGPWHVGDETCDETCTSGATLGVVDSADGRGYWYTYHTYLDY